MVDGELEVVVVETTPADPARGWLPANVFDMRVGGCKVGGLNMRVGNTHNVVMYAGHIGYAVDEPYRRRHYAERACRLILPVAKAHGMDTVWIMCNPDNVASRITCERLGTTLVEIVPVPEDNDLYKHGDRESCRYWLDLA